MNVLVPWLLGFGLIGQIAVLVMVVGLLWMMGVCLYIFLWTFTDEANGRKR